MESLEEIKLFADFEAYKKLPEDGGLYSQDPELLDSFNTIRFIVGQIRNKKPKDT